MSWLLWTWTWEATTVLTVGSLYQQFLNDTCCRMLCEINIDLKHLQLWNHWCLFCQYLYGIYSAKVISTEKWCLEWRNHKVWKTNYHLFDITWSSWLGGGVWGVVGGLGGQYTWVFRRSECKWVKIPQRKRSQNHAVVAGLERPCTGLVTLPSLALNVCKCIKEEDLFPTSLLQSWSKKTKQ